MKLSDSYNPDYKPGGGGGNYLRAGKHKVRIEAFSCGTNTNGKPFVEFQFENQDGQTSSRWYLTEAAIKGGHLANFAIACGLTKEELHSYDTDAENDHAKLINRIVVIELRLKSGSDRYHEVVNWERAGEATMAEIPTAAEANAAPVDDIPF